MHNIIRFYILHAINCRTQLAWSQCGKNRTFILIGVKKHQLLPVLGNIFSFKTITELDNIEYTSTYLDLVPHLLCAVSYCNILL